jgi:putative glutamine amidotransferase
MEVDTLCSYLITTHYCNAIEKAGGIPVLLPPTLHVTHQLYICKGIVFPGGGDVNPCLYGEEPHIGLGKFDSLVDAHQLHLAKAALACDFPLLGICKGMQILNIACGGNIYQDLSDYPRLTLSHMQKGPRSDYFHSINIEKNTKLYHLFGSSLLVNSFHHQIIHHLGDGFIASAHSKDGVIEAIEIPDKTFVLGVQWHPEVLISPSYAMELLFESFIHACL